MAVERGVVSYCRGWTTKGLPWLYCPLTFNKISLRGWFFCYPKILDGIPIKKPFPPFQTMLIPSSHCCSFGSTSIPNYWVSFWRVNLRNSVIPNNAIFLLITQTLSTRAFFEAHFLWPLFIQLLFIFTFQNASHLIIIFFGTFCIYTPILCPTGSVSGTFFPRRRWWSRQRGSWHVRSQTRPDTAQHCGPTFTDLGPALQTGTKGDGGQIHSIKKRCPLAGFFCHFAIVTPLLCPVCYFSPAFYIEKRLLYVLRVFVLSGVAGWL